MDLEAGNPTQKAATDFGGGTGNTGPIRYRIAVRSEGRRWAAPNTVTPGVTASGATEVIDNA